MKDKCGKCRKLELFRELEKDLKIEMKPYVKGGKKVEI